MYAIRSYYARTLVEDAEEPEELSRLALRDHTGEEGATQRLGTALYHPNQDREHDEVRVGSHVEAEDGDDTVCRNAQEDRGPCPRNNFV